MDQPSPDNGAKRGEWLRSAPRDELGRVISAKPKDLPSPTEPLGSEAEMVAEVFAELGGWRATCKMYARLMKSTEITANKRLDALNDFFKIALRDKSKALSEKEIDDMPDVQLAQQAAKFLRGNE